MKMTAWRHLECFEIPRNKKSEYATNAEFLTEEVEDESDDLVLASEEGIDSIAEKMGSKCEELNAKAKKEKQEKGGKKRKSDAGSKASVSDSELLQKLKEDAELLADAEDDEHGEPAKKKQKLSEMEVKRAEIYTKYAAMKTAELEDILVWNNLVKAGNKTAKMLRIVDGEANGRMGKCPICINGRLRLADSGEKGESNRFEGSSNSRWNTDALTNVSYLLQLVTCMGSFNEESNVRETCSYTTTPDSCPRLHPWYDRATTEEEQEEMKEQYEASGMKASKVPQELLDGINNSMVWDTSNPPAIKSLAQSLASYLSSNDTELKIPDDFDEDKIRQTIGPIIMANKDKAMHEIMQVMVEKFGLKEDEKKKSSMQDDAIANMCKVPENGKIYKVLNELANYYSAESNARAANTYRKLCGSIATLGIEITEDNIMGMAKAGKNKVDGMGKGSAEKIREFLTTGTMEKLEEKRKEHA